MDLRCLDALPEGLLHRPAPGLAEALGGPTLIHLRGRREPPLLVSVLLHGNETSGWNGLRRLLAETPVLPRSLILFIGNVDAAAAGLRMLPGQQDFNRIWRGAPGPEGELARQVLAALTGQPLFAALDLHNNTGHNPHYSVLTELSPDNLALAYLYSDKAVWISEPDTVLAKVFSGRCPAATLELGPVGDPRCDERARDILQRCLLLERIPDADPARLELFRALARVHVADGIAFSFAGSGLGTPLVLTGGIEAVNFHPLAAGSEFGLARAPLDSLLRVLDGQHRDVTGQWFEADAGGRIRLRRAVVPAMYTTDPLVIRQDCLCYFMERMATGAPGL